MIQWTPDTVVFICSLLACVPLGTLYKQIEGADRKRSIGAGIGLLVALVTCGRYVFYTIILVWGNVITLKCCEKRMVHQVSLGFTWLFLIYIHNFVQCTQYATWLFQILALRLVGLAFEMSIIYDKTKTDEKRPSPALDAITKLSTSDIFCYAYFFIGLQKGPYYTWKTFNDHFKSRISLLGDFRVVTEQKLKKAFLFAVGYLIIRSKYSLSMYEKEEFYVSYGTDYRFLWSVPQLVMFVLEHEIIMILSTSACTEAGFGVYPIRCHAAPGVGPTVPVKLTALNEELPENEEYNFSMLKCFDNEKLLLGAKMIETMRGWDMATRYWFSEYIMKNLVKSNFEVRSACSFLVWTIWAGPSLQNTIISLTLWIYVHLESEYAQLYAESMKGAWNLGFAIMRMFCLFYLTPCYIIDDVDITLRYYNSIYWIYHIVLGVLIVVAIALHRSRYGTQLGPNMFPKPDQSMPKLPKAPGTTSTVSIKPDQSTPKLAKAPGTTSAVSVANPSSNVGASSTAEQNRGTSDAASTPSKQESTGKRDTTPSTSENNPDPSNK